MLNLEEEYIKLVELVKEQAVEILTLKKLVANIGDKVINDHTKTEASKKISGTHYWLRHIVAVNKNDYTVCVVCEKVPNNFFNLKVTTCSPNCSLVIEELLTLKAKKGTNE